MNSPGETATASTATRVLVILIAVCALVIGPILTHREEEEEARWQKFKKDNQCVLVETKTERNAGYVADIPVNQTHERWKCDDGEHARSFISQ
jgi:hypothetical protein